MTGVAEGVSWSPWRLGSHGGEGGAAGGRVADRGMEPAGETPQQTHRGTAAIGQDPLSESTGCHKSKKHLQTYSFIKK